MSQHELIVVLGVSLIFAFKSSILNTKSIILNTKSIILNAFDTNGHRRYLLRTILVYSLYYRIII